MLSGKRTFRRAALALVASAALLPVGQYGAAAATVPAAVPATAPTAAVTGAPVAAPVPGPQAVVPAAVLAKPVAETLLLGGSTGFLHERGSTYLWTPYGGGASTTLSWLESTRSTVIGGWFGAGSDVVAQLAGRSVVLHDMGDGGATTTVAVPTGEAYEGTYGSTVLARTSGASPALHLLRAAADGSTTDTAVGGLDGATAFGPVVQGDATGVAVQYQDSLGFHLAVVDLGTAGATTVPGTLGGFQSAAQIAVTPTALVVQPSPQQTGVEVYDRADLSQAPASVSGVGNPSREPRAFTLVGDQVVGLAEGSDTGGATAGVVTYPVDGSTGSTLFSEAFPDVLPTPDGGALVAGTGGPDDGLAFYRVPPVTGDAAPQPVRTADVTPSLATTAGLALDHGTLSVVDNSAQAGGNPYETLYTRKLTLDTATPVVGARQPGALVGSVGSCGTAYSCSAQLIATGDGRTAMLQSRQPVKYLTTDSFEDLGYSTSTLFDADGGDVAYAGGSGVAFGDLDATRNVNDPPPLSVPGTTAAVWSGRTWVAGADGGLVSVFDPAKETLVATFATKAPCTIHDLQVVGRWLYWDCDDHTAGVYDWTRKTGFTLPSTGHGYGDALLGDGFLVYHDATAGQLVLADVHTGALTSTQDLTALGGGSTGPDRRVDWTVDRFTGAVAWVATDGTIRAEPTGVPASAPAVPTSTSVPAAAVPSWLVPVETEKDTSKGTVETRSCTGIAISHARVLTGADCFTGRSTNVDFWDYFNPRTHGSDTSGSGLAYRLAPHYNATTRQDDLGVHVDIRDNIDVSSTPVLATSADSKLYRAGAKATFYSWTSVGADGSSPRTAHAEPAVVRSAAACATLLGHALPSGMLCTSPAPGASVVSAQRCVGDDGGALVAGGKLIGVGATSATGCSASGVRLYTSVAAQHETIQVWARDIYTGSFLDGAATAVTSDGWIFTPCGDPMKSCLAGSGAAIADDAYNLVLQPGDLNGDGWGDLILRTKSGHLYDDTGYHEGVHNDLAKDAKTSLGTGWNSYNLILAPGDVNGDGLPDLLARTKTGKLYLYPGNGHGTFGARKYVSAGWNAYTIAAHGDFSGDGIADLLIRDKHGVLWRRNGNGHGGFTAKAVKLGTGFGAYTSLVVVGDQNGQGHNQLIGRLSNGKIYRWTDNGKGGLSAKVSLGGNSELRKARLT